MNKVIKKFKGIFFNFDKEINIKYEDKLIKTIRNLSYNTLALNYHQSIHHVNLKHYSNGSLDEIKIKFRKAGIKPEDIDINYLLCKEKLEQLSDYELRMLAVAKYHHNHYTKEELKDKIDHYDRKIEYYVNERAKLKSLYYKK